MQALIERHQFQAQTLRHGGVDGVETADRAVNPLGNRVCSVIVGIFDGMEVQPMVAHLCLDACSYRSDCASG